MYLIDKDAVKGIDNYYSSFINFRQYELLGFMPCTADPDSHEGASYYYAIRSVYGVVAPVLLGYDPGFIFNSDPKDRSLIDRYWIMFFPGCDDGSTGIRFSSREDAIQWINELRIVDFRDLLGTYFGNKNNIHKLEWYN